MTTYLSMLDNWPDLTFKKLKAFLIDTGLCINNKYCNKYVKLLLANQNTIKTFGYDNHHILPRYWFNYNKLDFNSKVIVLSRSNHALAHLYLFLCSPNSKYKYANGCAVSYLLHINKNSGITYDLEQFIIDNTTIIDTYAKEYAKLRSEKQSGVPTGCKPNLNRVGLIYQGKYHLIKKDDVQQYLDNGAKLGGYGQSTESKAKNRQAHLGKPLPHNDKWNKAISKGSKGKKLSEECKQKISDTLKGNTEKCGHIRGKIAINNGKIYKYVFEQDFIDNYQNDGWVKGIGIINGNTCQNKGKIRINNEYGAKYVTIDEWENKYSKEGWHRGYKWKKK